MSKFDLARWTALVLIGVGAGTVFLQVSGFLILGSRNSESPAFQAPTDYDPGLKRADAVRDHLRSLGPGKITNLEMQRLLLEIHGLDASSRARCLSDLLRGNRQGEWITAIEQFTDSHRGDLEWTVEVARILATTAPNVSPKVLLRWTGFTQDPAALAKIAAFVCVSGTEEDMDSLRRLLSSERFLQMASNERSNLEKKIESRIRHLRQDSRQKTGDPADPTDVLLTLENEDNADGIRVAAAETALSNNINGSGKRIARIIVSSDVSQSSKWLIDNLIAKVFSFDGSEAEIAARILIDSDDTISVRSIRFARSMSKSQYLDSIRMRVPKISDPNDRKLATNDLLLLEQQ